MIFQDFIVLENDGKTLVETLPAILYTEGSNIIAQVPSGTTSVTFTALSTGQIYTEAGTNGKATFTPSSNDTYRVGNETITKHNEVTIAGIKTLQDVKNEKLAELDQAFQASFTKFQSSALSTSTTTITKTYPINQEAQDNLKDLQSRLIADPSLDDFPFLTIEDRILVDHTRSQFLQLLRDASARMKDLHNQNRTYANKIADAIDIVTVQNMTFTFS